MPEHFTYEQIENEPKMQQFLRKKSGLAHNTIKTYIMSIKSFCNFTHKTPTEIYELHRDDLRNRAPVFDMWLNEALDNYVSFLIDSHNRYGTINLHITRIKGFYHTFKLIPTPDPDITINNVKEDSKYALDVEDIRKAIQNSTPTYQAFFITQAQTGLSLSDALLLDVEDFVQAVSKKNEKLTITEAIYRVKNENLIGCFDLRRKKTTVEFYTFVGPEALKYIASLLESRDEAHLTPESPIFMKDINRLSKSKAVYQNDLRLTDTAVKNYADRMHKSKKIFPRIIVDGKEKNYFRTHKLRKWFSNQLRFKANFSSDDTKYLMGQKTGDVLEQYIDTNNYNALKGNYRKALPYLAITEEVVMEENQEAMEKLEMDNKRLEEQMQKREEQHRIEMEEMKAKIDENQSTTEKLIQAVNSRSSVVKDIKLPSGKQSLELLDSILKEEEKNE